MHKRRLILIMIMAFCFFKSEGQSIYNYTLRGTDGDTIHLSDFTGKKILFVNTAGGSAKVDQYGKLEALYQLYKDSLVIIAIPSNSFGNELESDSALNEHVHDNYEITYLLAAKTEVTGEAIDPVYQWLTQHRLNGSLDNPVRTDFVKFMVGPDGKLIGVFSSMLDPLDEEIQNAIKNIVE